MIEERDDRVTISVTGSPSEVARQLEELFRQLERDPLGVPVYRLAWDTGADGEYQTEATVTISRLVAQKLERVWRVTPPWRRDCPACGPVPCPECPRTGREGIDGQGVRHWNHSIECSRAGEIRHE